MVRRRDFTAAEAAYRRAIELDPDDARRQDQTVPAYAAATAARWRDGLTGFPLVDACMRALDAGGWINFRMRAMLAAFATSILSAVVGMAGGITLLAVMLLFLEPLAAIPLHGVIQLVSNSSRAWPRWYIARARFPSASR